MIQAKLYVEDWEVNDRLKPFGVERDDLLKIVDEVVAARADAVEDDPVFAPGMFAYIYGLRTLRQVFRRAGWHSYRQDNIEGVRDPQSGRRIIYQNVDVACSLSVGPRAISSKGPGSKGVVDAAQGGLFDWTELERIGPQELEKANIGVWYFGVSVEDDKASAELFLPAVVEGNNFQGYIERIFLITKMDKASPEIMHNDDADDDYGPVILRK